MAVGQTEDLHQDPEIHATVPRKANLVWIATAFKALFEANRRLSKANQFKESFGQLWRHDNEGWARRFVGNWKASLES